MEKLESNETLQKNEETGPANEVVFNCSIKSEINRVKNTLKTLAWYKETGYRIEFIKLPKSINQKIEKGGEITEEEISAAVSEEFNEGKNTEQIVLIEEKWSQIKEKFFENLKTLGLPVQEKYLVSTTKYGSGGSYQRPNIAKLNFENSRGPYTLAHEIIHLTIENLIEKYKIEHWVKERIVDLIMNKFFPEQPKLQRMQMGSENAEKIADIFESDFPNIEEIIKKVSEIK
jgi:hypothetical protein